MAKKVVDRVGEWARQANPTADFRAIHSQIHYLSRLYDEYEPTRAPGQPQFIDRMSGWLDSVPDSLPADQQILFQLIPHIAFFGRAEFESLCHCAYNGQVARWLIDLLNIRLEAADAQTRLREEVRKTWFCAITDSMPIAQFYHLNGIQGVDLRPEWRSLHRLGNNNRQRIVDYMANNRLERIVLLEDFVGSGSQMKDAVAFATTLPNNAPVLLCPLIVAPDGVGTGRALELQYGPRLTFRPVLEIPEECFVRPLAAPNEHALYQSVRGTLRRLEALVKSPTDSHWHGNFGFRDTGGLVVMYTNCPDNTLPVIHYSADGSNWRPLFPRASRL